MCFINSIREECGNKGIDSAKLAELMNKAGEKYISQFRGEMRAANALALGAMLAGDADPYDFSDLSETMIKKSNGESKNYFEILLEECKKF